MSAHRTIAACRPSLSRLPLVLAASALLCFTLWCAAPSAPAQEPAIGPSAPAAGAPAQPVDAAPPEPERGIYLSVFWLALVVASTLAWLYVTAWVCDDARGTGLNFRIWTSYMLGAGLFGLLFTVLMHAAFSFLMLACVAVTFVVYAQQRNQVVPKRYKLFARGRGAGGPDEAGEVVVQQPVHLDVGLLNEAQESIEEHVAGRLDLLEGAQVIGDQIARAFTTRARVIRLEPAGEEHVVRLDLDGMLHNVETVPVEIGKAALAGIAKFVSGKSGGAVGGRMTAILEDNEKVEVVVRAVRSRKGPALVISMPDWTEDIYKGGPAALGMHRSLVERLMAVLGTAKCAVLISSPRGNGRTTTFHALVSEIDIYTTDVIALEQKVRHELEHVVRHEVNMESPDFPEFFAGILREEPHVIAVDELRSAKQAGPLFEFVQSGGRLLATVQADSSAQAVQRVLLGADAGLVSRTLACVLNQRLIRKLCEGCKEEVTPGPRILERLRIDPRRQGTWFKPVGCEQCLQTGYRGRTGLFELLLVNDAVRKVIAGGGASVGAIREAAGKEGLRTLFSDGILKVQQGLITLEEIRRVVK